MVGRDRARPGTLSGPQGSGLVHVGVAVAAPVGAVLRGGLATLAMTASANHSSSSSACSASSLAAFAFSSAASFSS